MLRLIHNFRPRLGQASAIGITLLLLSACGGGGSSGTAVNVTTPTEVASVLTLKFDAIDNYAAPSLPVYYDATVAALDNTPPGNPVTDTGATLGRVLFYDKNLSINNSIACAGCHMPAQGFSDTRRFSVGFSGSAFTTAHAMQLGNARYFRPGTAFWDRRAASLEAQASQPITNSVEMGFDATHGNIAAAVLKVQALPYYPPLFALAFGDSSVTAARIQDALAQFERSMISSNSRWDAGYASTFSAALPRRGLNIDVPGLSVEENRGRALFMGGVIAGLNCAACHVPPTFALNANSRSNGLDAGETTIFKSPSLKNAALASAFMHDGRFSTLAQVVEHYNSGVQTGPALDNRLLGPGNVPLSLNLSSADKAALVAFLNTLTDTGFVSDTKFSNPFK
jgi:cytochrome c peroxidase